jgi:hypothetical protein
MAVRTQSMAVSPPPTTTTCLPAALRRASTAPSPSCSRFDAIRYSSAGTTPSEPAPGTVPIARVQLIAGSGLPSGTAAGLSLDHLVAIHLDS